MNAAQNEARWMEAYLSRLVGGKITAVGAKLEDDFGYAQVWPTITVELAPDKQFREGRKLVKTVTLELSQDEEGNGPGFAFGLPHVEVPS